MVTIIRYADLKKLRKAKQPIFVYGRRKTGKTFLIKQEFNELPYFFVRRDGSIYYERRNENIRYEELIRMIEDSKGTHIIDEFHRLPPEFLEYIHINMPKNIMLITSTLHLARELLSSSSPILGLFSEFKLGLIDERDILLNLKDKIKNKKELVEYSVYLREPILLRFFPAKIWDILPYLKLTVPSLIGEIFTEEEREMSRRYEAIIRAISLRKNTLTEITAFLYGNKLLPRQDSSLIKPYLVNLLNMGILSRIEEYGKRKSRYFIDSPMIDLYYYLDEKYNFSERELERKYYREKIPHHVEIFFRNLLAKMFNKNPVLYLTKEYDIDIMLLDFKKIYLVGEVKWRKVSKKEIKEIEERLSKFQCRKMLIVANKDNLDYHPENIELWDVGDILNQLQSSL